jgi:hypothetical protein
MAAMGTRLMAAETRQTVLPTIVVALGYHVSQIKARSTMPLDTDRLKDDDALVAQEPNTFIYTHPQRGFTLPEARYVRLRLTLGVVTHFEVSPQVEYFNIDQAFEMACFLISLFDKSGWKRDPAVKKPVLLEELRLKFEDRVSDPRFKHGVGRWKNDDEELYVELARKHRTGEPYAKTLGYKEDKYLVTISISNKKLIDESYKKMSALRKEDGYNDIRPLSTVGKKKGTDK